MLQLRKQHQKYFLEKEAVLVLRVKGEDAWASLRHFFSIISWSELSLRNVSAVKGLLAVAHMQYVMEVDARIKF